MLLQHNESGKIQSLPGLFYTNRYFNYKNQTFNHLQNQNLNITFVSDNLLIMKNCLLNIVVFLYLILCCSCTEKSSIPEHHTYDKQLSIIFSPGGLGDSGYNDLILTGFQKIKKEYSENLKITFYTPDSLAQAKEILVKWLRGKNDYNDELFVLASSDYETMLKDVLHELYPNNETDPEKDILLLESYNQYSLPVQTLRITSFGASYMAGVQAASEYGNKPALIMAANPSDKPVMSAVNGFLKGWKSVTTEKIDTIYMSNDWNGFIQPDQAYQNMHEWSKKYGFIFPVAGGTNNGIYKYLREKPGSMKTTGMDVDQSYLSTDIIGSVLKHLDNLIYDMVKEWIENDNIQAKEYFGLVDGYSQWNGVFSNNTELLETAINEEYEYENQ